MNVLAVSVTERGRVLLDRLPYARSHGDLASTVRERWNDVDAFVLVIAVGAATRIVGPLLASKADDPAVVCVDDTGRWVIPLVGGHRGANDLARTVADLLGAEAVVTTASDASGTPALDTLPGLRATGDVAGVTRAILDGAGARVTSDLEWPLPAHLRDIDEPGAATAIHVSDRRVEDAPHLVALHPQSLVVGVGTSTDAPPDKVVALVRATLEAHGLAPESVSTVATIDRRRTAAGIVALDLPVMTFTADELAAVEVPTPSAVVEGAVGTPSVAEAAALLAAGADAQLIVPKQKNDVATVAVARRARPPGAVVLVGLGPGAAAHRTPAADAAVRSADVVVGYTPYVEQAASLLRPVQDVRPLPIGAEVERATLALELAAEGRRVAVVCSGDAGIYAMASIVEEIAPDVAPGAAIHVVPGVTAALAAAASLGAPLGNDHAMISLSDLLTPWAAIERRVEAAAAGGFVTVFYNPRSRGRDWQLPAALDILRRHRPPQTPVGIVTDAGRPRERRVVTTLADVDPADVGMTTCVIVGASTTRVVGGRMVTPRGYEV